MDDTVNLVAATDHEADLKALVSDILEAARDNGADAAEVSASEDAGLSVTVRLSASSKRRIQSRSRLRHHGLLRQAQRFGEHVGLDA